MAKARRGPALFELLGEAGGQTLTTAKTPRWWSGGTRSGDRHASRAARAQAPALESKPGVTDASPPGEGIVNLRGDRVHISLTSVSAAVVVFLALGLVGGAYVIGGRAGDRAGFQRGYQTGRNAVDPAADEVLAARSQTPATDVIAPLLANAPRGTEPAASRKSSADPVPRSTSASPNVVGTAARPAGWTRDFTYIVVQEFPTGAAEKSRLAQQFLEQRGIPTAVVSLPNGAVQLTTTQGFDHRDANERKLSDQFLGRIRALGSEFYAAGGGYRLEGYHKTLKRDQW